MTESLTVPKNWAPRFFTIWTGQAFSMLGSSLVQFALIWWLTQETGSATVLALASLSAMLPPILLGPLAGAIVDRYNRRLILILSDSLTAVATLVLVFLFAQGLAEVWHVYVLMAVRAVGGAFQWPAMSSSTSLMVPKDQLTKISGLNQMLQGLMGLAAPPIGALLIIIFPTQGVLLIDVFTALLAIGPLLFISIPQPVHADEQLEESKPSLWADMRAGFNFIVAWPGIMAIGALATIINFLLTPMGSLMPLLITKHFGLGALELGFTDTAWGIGILAGGLVLSAWGGFKRKIYTSLLGIAGLGLGALVVGLAPTNMYWLALAGMAVVGVMNSFTNGPLQAIVQSAVPAEMQGRVMSLIGTFAMAMSPLSLIIAGPVADAYGVQVWYIVGGGLSLLVGVLSFFIPVVIQVEENKQGTDSVASVVAAAIN